MRREPGVLGLRRALEVPHRLGRGRAGDPGSTAMRIFSSRTARDEEVGSSASEAVDEAAAPVIAGDRGIPSINRAGSLQSRVSSVLAVGLMSALGLGLLTWYYAKTLTRPAQAQ